MKRFLKFLVLALALFVPFTVSAVENKFTVIADDEVTSKDDVIGSSVLAGNNVTSTNSVNGINMLFGNNVNHKGDSDYALIAGNNVNVFGSIKNDGFIFGNLISFDSSFTSSRDVFVFGNTVSLKGIVNRDINIYASSVIIEDATIEGNVNVYTSSLEIKQDVEIKGVLAYSSDAVVKIDSTATIGSVELLESIGQEVTIKDQIYSFFASYAGVIIIFLVLALIVPGLFKRIEGKYEDMKLFDLFSSLGFGALLLIAVPIIFIMLLAIVIGTPLALLLLAFYIICILLSTIFTGYLLGFVIWKKFINKDINTVFAGLIGVSIIYILTSIPTIGVYFTIINVMVALGIIFRLFQRN